MIYDITNWIDKMIARLFIWRLTAGFGPKCKTKDTDDFPDMVEGDDARCQTCKAHEVIEWIEDVYEIKAPCK